MEDKRCIKTKQAICTTFLEIVATKPYQDITIQELAEKANINRKTFYRHYDGIFDVLAEIENNFVHKVEKSMSEITATDFFRNPYPIVSSFGSAFNDDLPLLETLVKADIFSGVEKKIKKMLLKKLTVDMPNNNPIMLSDCLDFVTGGMLSCFQSWIYNKTRQSFLTVCETITFFVINGAKKFLDTESKAV